MKKVISGILAATLLGGVCYFVSCTKNETNGGQGPSQTLGTQAGKAIICAVPTGLTASNVTATSAVLSWSQVHKALAYNVTFKAVSETSGHNINHLINTSVTLSSLTPNTQYEFEVQSVCASNGFYNSESDYSSFYIFQTLAQ